VQAFGVADAKTKHSLADRLTVEAPFEQDPVEHKDQEAKRDVDRCRQVRRIRLDENEGFVEKEQKAQLDQPVDKPGEEPHDRRGKGLRERDPFRSADGQSDLRPAAHSVPFRAALF
jgi:hypothetical protein